MTNRKKGMGSHQSPRSISDTYITPKKIIDELGPFDLDPCTPEIMPWKTAERRYTEKDNGLLQKWFGKVWLNPPWGNIAIIPWLKLMVQHRNGLLLMPARTETKNFKNFVFSEAHGILFLGYRPVFHRIDGSLYDANCGCPVVIAAYGQTNAVLLESVNLPGQYLPLKYQNYILISTITENKKTWHSVVAMAIEDTGTDKDFKLLYSFVEKFAKDKTTVNTHWKEKVRQKVYEIRKKTYYKNVINV